MTPAEITAELADCKSTNRYLTDARGDRFWVFGLPTGELLVRRVDGEILKPVRTMQYDEVVTIEGMVTTPELIADIQAEVGEASSAAVDLIGALTSAESCEKMEDLKANILEAKGIALLILSHLNDELSRINQGREQ